jgi:surface antigen
MAGGFSTVMYAIDAFSRSTAALHSSDVTAQIEEVRASPSFQNQNGQRCHDVEQAVTIHGQHVRAYATVCQQSNGTWALER